MSAPTGAAIACGVSSRLLGSLIDDAAMFPPKQANLHAALSDRLSRLGSTDDEFVGSFLVPAVRAGELLDALTAGPPSEPLPVGIVGSDDPAVLADAATRLARSDLVRLELLELRLDPATNPVDAVAEQVSGLGAAGKGCPARGPRILCEVPHRWLEDGRLVEAVAAMSGGAASSCAGLGAKLRTGGTEPQAFPTVAAVARFIGVCVQHAVAFKCTAGLHRAVRGHDPANGLLHHGFANVLLATHLTLVGAGSDAVRSALDERQPAAVATGLNRIRTEQAAAVRSAFLSYGSCDTATPVGDMRELLMAVQ